MKNLNLDGLIEEGFDYLKLGGYYRSHPRFKRLVKYTAVMGIGYLSGLPLMALFISVNVHWALANLFSAAIIHFLKFLGNDLWTWRR